MYLKLEVDIHGDIKPDLEVVKRIAERLFQNHVAFTDLSIEVNIIEHAGGFCNQCLGYEPGTILPDCTPEDDDDSD
jgi:hypothetical protein